MSKPLVNIPLTIPINFGINTFERDFIVGGSLVYNHSHYLLGICVNKCIWVKMGVIPIRFVKMVMAFQWFVFRPQKLSLTVFARHSFRFILLFYVFISFFCIRFGKSGKLFERVQTELITNNNHHPMCNPSWTHLHHTFGSAEQPTGQVLFAKRITCPLKLWELEMPTNESMSSTSSDFLYSFTSEVNS